MITRLTHTSRIARQVVIIGCVVFYTTLLVMSFGCTFVHTAQGSQDRHHHDDKESTAHTALCAWTCQATADVAVAIGPSSSVIERLVGQADLTSHSRFLPVDLSETQSRAPPSSLLVGLW